MINHHSYNQRFTCPRLNLQISLFSDEINSTKIPGKQTKSKQFHAQWIKICATNCYNCIGVENESSDNYKLQQSNHAGQRLKTAWHDFSRLFKLNPGKLYTRHFQNNAGGSWHYGWYLGMNNHFPTLDWKINQLDILSHNVRLKLFAKNIHESKL